MTTFLFPILSVFAVRSKLAPVARVLQPYRFLSCAPAVACLSYRMYAAAWPYTWAFLSFRLLMMPGCFALQPPDRLA